MISCTQQHWLAQGHTTPHESPHLQTLLPSEPPQGTAIGHPPTLTICQTPYPALQLRGKLCLELACGPVTVIPLHEDLGGQGRAAPQLLQAVHLGAKGETGAAARGAGHPCWRAGGLGSSAIPQCQGLQAHTPRGREPLAQAVSCHEHSLALEVRGQGRGEDGGKGSMLWQPPARTEGECVCSRPGLVSGLTPSGSCTQERASPVGHSSEKG